MTITSIYTGINDSWTFITPADLKLLACTTMGSDWLTSSDSSSPTCKPKIHITIPTISRHVSVKIKTTILMFKFLSLTGLQMQRLLASTPKLTTWTKGTTLLGTTSCGSVTAPSKVRTSSSCFQSTGAIFTFVKTKILVWEFSDHPTLHTLYVSWSKTTAMSFRISRVLYNLTKIWGSMKLDFPSSPHACLPHNHPPSSIPPNPWIHLICLFVWISNFSCSLTRNITSHSMKNLAFRSSLVQIKDDYTTDCHYFIYTTFIF